MRDDYRELLETLSAELPKWGLEAADLSLTPAELALVIGNYGSGEFISDALGERRGAVESDTFDAIAIRATAQDINQAWIGCGVAVMAAIQKYATALVLRDVEHLRLVESTPRYTDRASAG